MRIKDWIIFTRELYFPLYLLNPQGRKEENT